MNELWKQSEANKRQVGADHYKNGGEEHWDRVSRLNMDYFQAQITKYVERCWDKNGIEDLEKAKHFLEKYIELSRAKGKRGKKEQSEASGHVDVTMLGIGGIDYLPEAVSTEGMRFYKDGEILTTGWAQFVYEGTNAEGNLFTCRECKKAFYAPVDKNPHGSHSCHSIADAREEINITGSEEPTKSYTNQG